MPDPKPGQEIEGGRDVYHPDEEPDLVEFARHRVGGFPLSDYLHPAIGFVTPSGHGIDLSGDGGPIRFTDHREILPFEDAQQRWGWPKHTWRTEQLHEHMRRAKLVRMHSSGGESYFEYGHEPTPEQIKAISQYVNNGKHKLVVLQAPHGHTVELTTPRQIASVGAHIRKSVGRG
jgi:hypothetical protein